MDVDWHLIDWPKALERASASHHRIALARSQPGELLGLDFGDEVTEPTGREYATPSHTISWAHSDASIEDFHTIQGRAASCRW